MNWNKVNMQSQNINTLLLLGGNLQCSKWNLLSFKKTFKMKMEDLQAHNALRAIGDLCRLAIFYYFCATFLHECHKSRAFIYETWKAEIIQ